MKKRILIWALMLTVVVGSSFANKPNNVDEDVVTSFKKDFASAKDVKFEAGKELIKATFTLNGQVMFAYYSETGDLLAVTRNLVSGQLPINLLTSLKKNYGDFWISELFEVSSENESTYVVTMESADYTLVLKSVGKNNWEVFKRDRKNMF